jgi:hypothetical protein
MNFLPLKLAANGLGLESEPVLEFPAPANFLDHLRARQIDRVVVGIRPHFVELQTRAASGRDAWPAKLLHAIRIGRDVHADFAVAGHTIKAELPGEMEVQSDATVRFPPEHCFFFGPDGLRLGWRT